MGQWEPCSHLTPWATHPLTLMHTHWPCCGRGIISDCVRFIDNCPQTHFAGVRTAFFWDLLRLPCGSLGKPMVITHHNYHVHLHCGMARIKIPPLCLSEQRAENLSEDRYFASNLKVLNFFHMSLWDSLLFYWKATWQIWLGKWSSSKEVSLCSVIVPTSHVKDSSHRIAHY